MELRTIATNGIRMRIAEEGSGPLVLLLHGFPESWYSGGRGDWLRSPVPTEPSPQRLHRHRERGRGTSRQSRDVPSQAE